MPLDQPTFQTTRLRAGYDAQQVDLAVAMILENLSLPEPRIGPGDLADIRFSTVSYRVGYDIEQVDDWLDDVSDELARRTGEPVAHETTAAEPVVPATAPVTRSDAIVEVRSSSPRVLVLLVVVAVLAVAFYAYYASYA